MPSTNTLGKYQITREIARSNDIVYEAVDPEIGRRVALKELYLPANLTGAQKRERIERFLREGKAAGKLAHPSIVTIYDVGQDGGRFYIAMEFLEGQTLREVLQQRGALQVKEALDILVQLTSALSYAHQHNVVHRDVKPENVQILPGGHVKLTDFGIARIMSEPSITADGQVFGTPSYMSPEQVSGRQIDGRSDIFSLGVLLYEMLAGHKPFSGDTVVTITYNIMNTEPPPPPGVPPHLVAVIRKAMAKDRNLRYQTTEQMAEDARVEPPWLGPDFKSGPNQGGDPFATVSSPGYQPTYGGPPPTQYYPPGPQPVTPGPQSVPDPFAHAPAQYTPPPVPIPRQPILSAETRAFLGIMMLVIGLAGMLVFAVWAVNEAYAAYVERTAMDTANRYIVQGDKLQGEGKTQAAIEQYSNAIRAGGTTTAGKDARRKLAALYVELARQALTSGSYGEVAEHAKRAVEADPEFSAGHYYLGTAAYYLGDRGTAEAELAKAIKTGGNDEFAIAARKLLSKLYVEMGDSLAATGRRDQAVENYQKAVDLQDPDWAPIAESRMYQ